MSEVVRLLNGRHANHYKVYNLCCERSYSPDKFTLGRCAVYPYEDHSVPPMSLIFDFCRHAPRWQTPCSSLPPGFRTLGPHAPHACES